MKSNNVYFLLLSFFMFSLAACQKDQKQDVNGVVENQEISKPSISNRILFQHDFSQPAEQKYSFNQSSISSTRLGGRFPDVDSYAESKGDLIMEITSAQKADIIISDLTMKFASTKGGVKGDTMVNNLPGLVMPDMLDDGSFEVKTADAMYEFLFRLPGKEMKVGERVVHPLTMPYNIGSRILLDVTGTMSTVFKNIETLDGNACAVLESVIEVSKYSVPNDLEGTYDYATTGTATHYFDIQNRKIIKADIVINNINHAETKDENTGLINTFSNLKNTSEYHLKLVE